MLLQDDKKKYGMKDDNVVESLNANPRTKMFGIENAIEEAMLDLEDAQKNNNASAIKTIGARINSLDKARIELQNILPENRIERSIGGIIKKLTKEIMKPKGSLLDEGAEAIRIANLESFTYDDAVRAYKDKDMTMSEINQTLQAAGYPQKDIQEFTKELGSMFSKPKPSLAKDALKKAENKKTDEIFNSKMSQEEIDEALDKLTGRGDFADGGMVPDEQMEDEYLDFILDEALDSEEEDYLMSQLQDNDRLSEIFDKVIDVAQEFAGSGPVEGPGSGVSDSIPARLSDGEFVFTAKAVDEIGADNLMAMMKDAEMKADERQGLAEGGQPEEEETVVMPVEQPASQQDIRVTKTTVGTQASMQEEQDLIGDEVKKSMLRGSRNLG
jgi:chaperonin cofactor prefoldin